MAEMIVEEKFVEVKGMQSLKQLVGANPSKLTFLYFYAEWNEDSVELSKIVKDYFEGYLIDCNFGFVDSDLDENLELCSRFEVETVPAALMVDTDCNKIISFDQIDPVNIYESIEAQIALAKQNYEVQSTRAFNKLQKKTTSSKVVLLTESSPTAAATSQSTQKLSALLHSQNIKFEVCSVDSDLSKWISVYSEGSNTPLLYVDGKMVGGTEKCGILAASGELLKIVPRECVQGDARAEFEAVVGEEKLILFVTSEFEGQEEVAAKCDSCLKQMQLKGLIFRNYDVKGKPQVLEIAKSIVGESFALPFLFQDGKPYDGGESLISKVQKSDLKNLFDSRLFREDAFSQIRRLVNSHPVFAFIKGTPEDPQCGFTSQLMEILDQYKVDFKSYNILEDHMIREKIKEFANWKTFPQLYVKGQLVGGLDIVKELIEDGQFKDTIDATS